MTQTAVVGGNLTSEHKTQPCWHALAADQVLALLGTDRERGLSRGEAAGRLGKYGPNRLVEEREITFWKVAREEITEPMILLLLAVGVIYALWGEVRDAIAIFFIVTGISFVEIYNEYRAKAAIASLQRLSVPTAPTIRAGLRQQLLTRELVPGDLVLLNPGERVGADLRLLEAVGLRIDESSLTGESFPVHKIAEAVPQDAELGDRRSMAYAGTLVRAGKGLGVVVATGMATEIGRIAGLVRAGREPRTPLQTSMRQLAGWLVWVALGFSVLVPALGFLFGQPLREMVLTGLTLAFATIPEEMPILITVVLGLGSLRLSRRQAIVKRLRAAETLGSVSVIASDKTGTITENHMSLVELWPAGSPGVVPLQPSSPDSSTRRILETGVLANDAVSLAGDEGNHAGDPTDVAFMEAARRAGLDPHALRTPRPQMEFAFDEERRLVSALYPRESGHLLAAKGAPEAIISRCGWVQEGEREIGLTDGGKQLALDRAAEMAARGLRVLALAYRRLGDGCTGQLSAGASPNELERDLVFLGLAGLQDPPRAEVPRALEQLRQAGIRVLMLTGDHPVTARAVATAVGIDGGKVVSGRELDTLDDDRLRTIVGEVAVYARITPEHKLRIVRSLQDRGEVVAVTGDGVNDAPALKEAAIGIAMGQTGTDVAKEAADMVLADDNFATIAVAVREGRKLFENLRKAVRYYLAAKVALVTSALVAVLAQLPVPFSPIQIIVTELFMDLGASIAFTVENAEGDVMARPPRDPRHPFMDRSMQAGILLGGLSLAVAVVAAYLWTLASGAETIHAQSVAFTTWMVGHVLLALQMRSERQPLTSLGLLSNPALVLWGVAAFGLVLLSANLPILRDTLKITPLSPGDWAVALLMPVLTTSWWEGWKLHSWRRGHKM